VPRSCERERVDLEPAVRSPIRHAHPFDGFDKLPFDKLRVCDTAGRLRMTLSGVEWVRVPSEAEGAHCPPDADGLLEGGAPCPPRLLPKVARASCP
jgi:hypothetical protein